jgi:hypothetical protein
MTTDTIIARARKLLTLASSESENVAQAAEINSTESSLMIGQWFWVTGEDGKPCWLAAVVHIGSNFVKLQGLRYSKRVHFDNVEDELTFEPDGDRIWAERAARKQAEIRALMVEVVERTKLLGIQPRHELAPEHETRAIALLGSGTQLGDYKTALALAQKELPELFKQIKNANEQAAKLMAAPLIPLKAQGEQLSDAMDLIEGRIYNVDLYAGLSEQVKQIKKGKPAHIDEPLHVRQRMLYMDEECLPFYQAGGMKFDKLSEFDRWLSRPEVRDRLLPEPRCVVAFQVRRTDRKFTGGDSLSAFIQFWYESRNDKATFLYIRNGERLYRLSTDFDFKGRLFPEADHFTSGEPLMARCRYGDRIEEVATLSDYETRAQAAEEARANGQGWNGDSRSNWHPYSPDSIYHDDIAEFIADEIKHYNHVALILQGLFDRSDILHPHHPVKSWTAEGFAAAIRLVRDDDRALAPADMPDFAAFQARCNERIGVGATTVGQHDAWFAERQEKYTSEERMNNNRLWSDRGPPKVATVAKFKPRAKQCTYVYTRETNRWHDDAPRGWVETGCSFTCDADKVLCVDGYQAGDFLQFYNDPRTRQNYLQWAPLLLAAEDAKAAGR